MIRKNILWLAALLVASLVLATTTATLANRGGGGGARGGGGGGGASPASRPSMGPSASRPAPNVSRPSAPRSATGLNALPAVALSRERTKCSPGAVACANGRRWA